MIHPSEHVHRGHEPAVPVVHNVLQSRCCIACSPCIERPELSRSLRPQILGEEMHPPRWHPRH
jgi:hypothetical protein